MLSCHFDCIFQLIPCFVFLLRYLSNTTKKKNTPSKEGSRSAFAEISILLILTLLPRAFLPSVSSGARLVLIAAVHPIWLGSDPRLEPKQNFMQKKFEMWAPPSHYKEIKIRIYYIFLSFIFTWICSFLFCEQIIYILSRPLVNAGTSSTSFGAPHLIFTELTEAFFAQLKVSFFITLYLIVPLVQYQVRLFVEPGLFAFEKKTYISLSILSLCLALLSSIFTYFLLLPAACKFFLSFETASVQVYLNPRMSTYLTFVLGLLSGCYFFFQLPILVLIFFKWGLLDEMTLVSRRKLSYLFFLFLSILISPPDLWSQGILILPIFFFYELTIFVSLFMKVTPYSIWSQN